MNNDIDITIVNYLKTLLDLDNEKSKTIYEVINKIDNKKKSELLILLDDKIKEKNKILKDLSTKITLTTNELEEFKEKNELEEITF